MTRMLGIIPAHNEAASLSTVIAELRRECPALDIAVVDDGSSDRTASIAEELDVIVIRLSERLGLGNAVRAGLRYAARTGYSTVVRLDGDGQHSAADVSRVASPVLEGRADVVFGSRFLAADAHRGGVVRWAQRGLGLSLSAITGRRVTDPTSGFCAFGPRAIRLLAEHHPTGYPEPELALLVKRSGLIAIEEPVTQRQRVGGRSSLTPRRVTAAIARVVLAMLIVPLRGPAPETAGD